MTHSLSSLTGLRAIVRCALVAAGTATAFSQSIVQEYFVPMPEAQIRQTFLALASNTGTTMDTTISMVAAVSGTKIIYDHWEDGYEINLDSPTQASTQIWGDGNDANGKPPGFANDPVGLSSGAVIALRNSITLPRNPTAFLYDGRDRLGATRGIVVSRSSWATTPGSVLADATEVYSTIDWGTNFVIPVGENEIFPTPASASMFELCSLFVQASQSGTQVQIDKDANGSFETTVTLNQGETYYLERGLLRGAAVTASKPVQVDIITGDIGGNYECRWYTVAPTSQWGTRYYSPVGTASDGDDTYVFLYNPDSAAITINTTTRSGTGSFSIPAKSNYIYLMPQDSGASFINTASKPFYALATVGAEPTANNVHDWGFSLVQEADLTTTLSLGWGPGSSEVTPTVNGNPAWVTAVKATTLYVDYNGDRIGSLTDPKDGKYDVAYNVSALQVVKLFDPDKDQTGMRIYTLDGTLIAGAWGQDPATAGPGNPYLDAGTTIPSFPVPVTRKTSAIAIDANTTGLSVGDTLEYTITMDNAGLIALGNLVVVDGLPAQLTYVANSTTRDGTALADNVSPATAFPLDASGYNIPILPRGQTTTFKYRAVINGPGNIANTVTTPYAGVTSTNVVSVAGGGTTALISFTNAAGTAVTGYTPGEGVYVTVTDPDANTSSTTQQTLTVTVRNSTTGDYETITLTETTVSSGIFRNTAPLASSAITGFSPADGTLGVQVGNNLTVSYTDPVYLETANAAAVVNPAAPTKVLYLSDTNALDRIDPVATGDSSTSSTASIASSTATVAAAATTTTTALGPVSSVTLAHTTGTGANRLMLVAVNYEDDGTAGIAINTVTYGGVPLTLVGSRNSDQEVCTQIWRLINPASGTANIVVNGTGIASGDAVHVGATTFTGVNQTTPLGTLANAIGTGTTASVTATSAVGEIVFATLSLDDSRLAVSGAGQVDLWNGFAGTLSSDGVRSVASLKAGAASVASTWTTGSDAWAALAVSIKPALASTTVSFTQTPVLAENLVLPSGSVVGTQVHYAVSSGTMPASPAVTATLRYGSTTIATSTSATANATTGSGLMTFTFPALSSAVTVPSGQAITLDITSAVTGVTYQINYDSVSAASRVTLPTTTVIHTDLVGVYDAPYPGGTLVTSPANGQILYVRALVGDPFGAYDITSVPLAIDGPGTTGDINVTLTDANVVASTAATKLYQYEWRTGSTPGAYSVVATAKEGYESITSQRSTTVNLSFLDVGTPAVAEFTNSGGTSVSTYTANQTIFVRVTDLDQNTNSSLVETVTVTITNSSGDTETITLTETGADTGIFTGSVPASATVVGTSNNGTLYAPTGSALNMTYVDPTDSTDVATKSATVPAPTAVDGVSISKVLVSPASSQVVVGETLQYRLRVVNTGGTTLSTVGVTDTFPTSNLTYVSATVTPTTVSGGTLTWSNVGPLTQGQSTEIFVTFTATGAGGTVTNSASATAGTASSNSSANVTITRPRVTVSKTLTSPVSGTAGKGDNVVFSIAVQNSGTTAIPSLPLEDIYSNETFEYVSSTLAPDAVGSGSLLWNDITGSGSLAVGATQTISVTLKVKGAANPATNLAAVNYATDVNGAAVPPSSGVATLVTSAASISGFVEEDKGVAGPGGDVPLSGVTLTLYSDPNGDGDPSDGVVLAVKTTLADGSYEFPNLGLGNYVVVESNPPGYSDVQDSEGANDNRIKVAITTFTATTGRNFLDKFIDPALYSNITGTVKNDTDGDGDTADVDAGISGVTVDLYTDPNKDGNPSDGTLYATVLTNGSGVYAFNLVPPGSYVVIETDLPGYVSTRDKTLPNDNQVPVTVAASQTSSGNDFLDTNNLTLLGTVGNAVWSDVDNNGIFDSGEVGIPNVIVQLYKTTQVPGAEAPFRTTTTGLGGIYSFPNVSPGNYVVYLPVANFTAGGALNAAPLSSAFENAADNRDHGISNVTDASTRSGTIAVAANVTNNTIDFGFVPNTSLGTISGTVLDDTNNDNTGDTGIAGVIITLWSDPNRDGDTADGVQIGTRTTASNGSYSFTGLPPGGYVVIESQPAGYLNVSDTDGGTNLSRVVLVLAPGATGTASFVEERPGTVTGHLYIDTNGNSVQDGVEPNLADVDVLVTDSNGTVHRVTSGSNGNWTATNVAPGSASAAVDTLDPQYPSTHVRTEGSDPTVVIVPTNGTVSAGNDGYYRAATLFGRVYRDVLGDGSQNGPDTGLSGIIVRITDILGVVRNVTTNATGDWTVSVPPGLTTVDVLELDSSFPTGAVRIEGADPNTVEAVAGASTNGGTDGYYFPGTVTGHLYLDVNGNSVQDSGESPLANVDVIITTSTNTTIVVSTDSSGNWTASVPPGVTSADVDETDPQFPANAIRTQGTDPTSFTAIATQVVQGGIDGYFVPALVQGHLYLDTNGNGVEDSGEPALVGVAVKLTDSLGNVQNLVTNASGNWQASVPPGPTIADVIDTDPNIPTGAVRTEGTDPTTFTALAGATANGGKDGYYQAAGVNGHLYVDTNGDGTQNGAEAGLPNITITVTDSQGVVRTVVTDANGNWSLSVPPGSTLVDVDQNDPDFPAGGTLSQGTDPVTVTAPAGGSASTGPIGYKILGVVTGHLYIDVNNNHTQDGIEPNIAGVDVVITDSLGATHRVTTDSAGNWTVSVPPGLTQINVDEIDPQFPTGSTQSEGTDPNSVTAVAGTTVNGGIDGYYISTSVTGTLYVDLNHNNVRDSGEPGLSGASVTVTDSNSVVQTVLTDGDGVWVASVAPGTTTTAVVESGPAFPSGFVRTQGTGTASINALSNTANSVPVTGYYFPGIISGELFSDTNGNGIKDENEPPLQNVTINIIDSLGASVTVTTGTDGKWSATVPPGPTIVDIDDADTDIPAGSVRTTSGPDPVTVTAVSGQNTPAGSTAGFYQAATVTGLLYRDVNGNGSRDPGEPALPNVNVFVAGSNGMTQIVVTNANGEWTASVPPGTTVIDIDESDPQYPAGATQTEGTALATVNAVAGSTANSGASGFFIPAVITGHLYLDLNGNGQQDFVVHNLANVDILVTDSNGATQVVVTNENGDWTATVPPGPATATVVTSDPEYPTGSEVTQGSGTTAFTAVAGTTTGSTPVGFFFPAYVTGHLYIDSNGNGVQDGTEANLEAVNVRVTSAINNTQTVVTDSNGNWSAKVPPGLTVIDIDNADPEYPLNHQQTQGSDPSTVLAVANLTTFSENDGFYLPGSVSGHLFTDVNGNGMEDSGEPGLAGVDIIVTDSNGNTQVVTTDASGNWSAPVPPGQVTVDIDDSDPQIPTGSVRTTTGNDPVTVSVIAGQDTPAGTSAGYFLPASVTGRLYADTNGNSTQQAGEPGLANVNVRVTDSLGNLQVVVTDADGNWTASVPPGSVEVKVDLADPDFPLNVVQREGTDPTTVTAIAGQSVSAGNDGYYLAATVTGLVYRDVNGNGIQDGTEPGLANLKVRVTDSNGVAQQVLTNASGVWSASVPPGETIADVLELDADFPDGGVRREGSDPSTVVAIAGSMVDAGNDGYYFPATLAGRVVLDTNGNALVDGTEGGIGNIDIQITDSNLVVQTVTTDVFGYWSASVPPGEAQVKVITSDPDFPTGTTQTIGEDPTTVTAVAVVSTDAGVDGYFIPATVSGLVYKDTNGNGLLQGPETGLAGVTVTVIDSRGITHTTATDASGAWSVAVPPGQTEVTISTGAPVPAGSTVTQGVTSTTLVAIAGASTDIGRTGLYQAATLSGHLYNDVDGSGSENAGDTPLVGVDVKITDSLGVVRIVTTDINGNWTVSLPPGTAIVDVDQADPDFPAGGTLSQGTDPQEVTAVAGTTVPTGTLGYRILGIVFGHLYVDVNNNGAQDPGEPNLAGITVTVTDSASAPHVVETDANGNWTANIPPGLAEVNVDQADPGFPSGASQSEGTDPSNVTAVAGTSVDAGNDGYYISTLVTGTIYIDVNHNNQRDLGEPGLPGVKVEVTDVTTTVRTVTTDADGNWAASVAAGAVTTHILETGPVFTAGYVRTEGTGNGSATAVGGTPASVAINGYYFPGTLSGHLYLDTNGNGEQDGTEPALADVEVEVTDSNGDATILVTDTNGDWSISLPPGPANIHIDPNGTDLPAGAVQSEGTNPTVVTVVSGQTTDGGTDGYHIPATVTGHLYVDTNGNSTQDPDEPNAVGVRVTVVGSSGVAVNVVTGSHGNWTASVPPGSTVIDVNEADLPAGSVQTQGQALTTVTALANDTVSGGVNGYFLPALVTGHLYLDLNGNGQQDFVFHNLANVDIIVVDSTGTTRRVTTDLNGDWSISLPPGPASATVDPNDPEYPTGSVITEGAATTQLVALAGDTVVTRRVGFFFPAVVTGHLYVDTNGNGTQDEGEPDLANVSIVVTSAINNTQTVTTDADGNWVATVPPGTTGVNISAPVGYQQTEGTNPSNVTAVASLSTFTENDGFYLPGTVSGHVYADINGNNVQDGLEAGIAGVNVTVTDSNGTVQVVTTDSNGDWVATVPPGATTVDVNDLDPQIPAGSVRTEGTDPQTVAAVAGLEVSAGNDGYFTPGTISGLVRSDTNNDGTPDLPIAGVTITLFDSGNVEVATTTTAADGSYSFTGLQPGTYSVRETQPAGYLSVSDVDAGDPNIIGNITPIDITPGLVVSGRNFLERPLREPNTFAAWQALHGLGGSNGPGQNPDGDLFNNLIEYAFATPPDSGAGNPFCLVNSVSEPGTIDAVYTRTAGGATDVVYQLETISSLSLSPGGWTPVTLAPADVVVTDNGDGTETVRILDLQAVTGLTNAGFVRIHVFLDANGDTVPEADAVTETGGWVKSDWGTQCRTYNNAFISCPVFSGIIDGVSGQQLGLQVSAGSSDLTTALAPGSAYYIEIVSGDWVGHRFDVTARGTGTLTLALDSQLNTALPPFNTLTGALPATLAGDRFVVRVHTTLGQMFPTGAFTATGDQETADQVQTYAAGIFTTYWLYENGGNPKWVRVGDGTLSDQSTTIIPPDRGMFINCLGAPGSLLVFGKVRANDFVLNLAAGNNLVRGGYPMDESPLSRSMSVPAGFYGDRDFKKADQIFIWKGDALTGLSGYDTYFLVNSPTMQPAQRRWLKIGDSSAAGRDADTVFKRDNSAFIKVANALPAHKISLPWQP